LMILRPNVFCWQTKRIISELLSPPISYMEIRF
jgi:hypothetical protein